MSPGLTFIDLCSEQMGKVAAELLLEQIEKSSAKKPCSVVLNEKLIIKNTTASPAVKQLAQSNIKKSGLLFMSIQGNNS